MSEAFALSNFKHFNHYGNPWSFIHPFTGYAGNWWRTTQTSALLAKESFGDSERCSCDHIHYAGFQLGPVSSRDPLPQSPGTCLIAEHHLYVMLVLLKFPFKFYPFSVSVFGPRENETDGVKPSFSFFTGVCRRSTFWAKGGVCEAPPPSLESKPAGQVQPNHQWQVKNAACSTLTVIKCHCSNVVVLGFCPKGAPFECILAICDSLLTFYIVSCMVLTFSFLCAVGLHYG